MTITRRSVLAGVAGLAATSARAQTPWPSRPIRLYVSFPPGGSSDLVARLLGQFMSERLGQPFVVDNRPGGGGSIAAVALQREAADGHALMLSNLAPFSIAPTQMKAVPYDTMRDFTHVSYIGGVHLVLVASPRTGITSLQDLIARAKREPGKLNYGSSGQGSWSHVVGEFFKAKAGVDIVHVPYRGSAPMRQDFLAGTLELYFDSLPQNLPSIRAGEGRALGVSSAERLALAPDIATFREQGQDIVVENWLGFSAPAGLPTAIAERIDQAVKAAIALPQVQAQFAQWGVVHRAMSPQAFSDYVARELAAWRPMIIEAGAQES
jgi:tripartite-type tricarboxylate transporter receptor subunit TctC